MILDTNGLFDFLDGNRSAITAVEAAKRLAIPVIVVGEYRFGIAQSRYRKNYERIFEALLARSAVFDVDLNTTLHYSTIRLELKQAGTPIPTNDLWIAALCRQHGMPLMSRDAHFDRVRFLDRRDW